MDASDPSYPVFSINSADPSPAVLRLPTRGVFWVLRWAVSLVTIFVAFVQLANFGFQLAAEHTLGRAARAGALEATLPRATYQTVVQTVQRRLQSFHAQSGDWQVQLTQNGTPVATTLKPRGGDQFSVVVSLSERAALPAWLRTLNFWPSDSPIEAHAERRMPSREMAPQGSPGRTLSALGIGGTP